LLWRLWWPSANVSLSVFKNGSDGNPKLFGFGTVILALSSSDNSSIATSKAKWASVGFPDKYTCRHRIGLDRTNKQ